jgi:endoglucanase
VTEFGDEGTACSPDFAAEVISYAATRAAGWTAWGWYPKGCTFPSLIDDWAGTPSALGSMVEANLASYDDPPASAARP